jgi:hypothetical protein
MDDIATTGARRAGMVMSTAGEAPGEASAVSWAAIFAGAAAAAALSLILLVLGTGLGLASVSPWSSQGVEATTFGVSTIVWITFMALAASAVGGYLAGRLRTKWAGVHTDEVYFRDTAHGFLAWAVATLVTAATLTSAIGAVVGAGAQAGSAMVGAAGTAATAAAGGAAAAAGNGRGDSGDASPRAGLGYFTDSLFRANVAAPAAGASAPASPSTATPTDAGAAARTGAEATRIFVHGLQAGSLAAEDTRHLGQLVAQRTGMSQQDAERRVTDTFARAQAAIRDAEAKAKEAADKARKAGAYASLWIFVSLLIGAFAASLAATYGGRRRDL